MVLPVVAALVVEVEADALLSAVVEPEDEVDLSVEEVGDEEVASLVELDLALVAAVAVVDAAGFEVLPELELDEAVGTLDLVLDPLDEGAYA